MRLIRLLLKCIFPCKCCLPKDVHNKECIVRCVYSSMNVNPNNGVIKPNFYKPQATEDGLSEAGVSTVRRSYSRLNFIKHHCKCQQNPTVNRNYYGFAYLKASAIRSCENGNYRADIVSTPTPYPEHNYNLHQHADIIYGFVPIRNHALPAEINFIIESLLVKTQNHRDAFPESKKWSGSKIK